MGYILPSWVSTTNRPGKSFFNIYFSFVAAIEYCHEWVSVDVLI